MKKNIVLLVFLVVLLLGCTPQNIDKDKNSEKIKVAVAILPLKDFIEKVAGDKVEVVVAIPRGASPANYQPSPQEIKNLVDSKVYFSIGLPTEKGNILPKLEDEGLEIVYLDKSVDEVFPPRLFDDEQSHNDLEQNEHSDNDELLQGHKGRDPHIWTSPKRAILMLDLISDKMSQILPKYSESFKAEADAYAKKISEINENFKEYFKNKNISFIVFHPSLGYFADDYGLEMISIEKKGKKTGASHIKEVIDIAREKNIKIVLYQHEFYSQSAEQIASEIGVEAKPYTVLWDDYEKGIKNIVKIFE